MRTMTKHTANDVYKMKQEVFAEMEAFIKASPDFCNNLAWARQEFGREVGRELSGTAALDLLVFGGCDTAAKIWDRIINGGDY